MRERATTAVRTPIVIALALAAAVALGAPGARGDGPAPALVPKHRLVWGNLLALRYNPLGIEDRIDLEYRRRLIEGDSILWRDTYVGLGLTPTVNAAVSRIGATFTLKPIALAWVSLGYYYVVWYGAFGHLRGFGGEEDDFSDTAIDRGAERAAATTGHEVVWKVNLVLKIGPIAIANTEEWYWARMNLRFDDGETRGDAPYYYQPRLDLLMANPGVAVVNDTDLVYVSDFGLAAGIRNTMSYAFNANAHGNGPTDRLGPLLAYVFFDEPRAGFNKPTILLITGWWLAHRFRTGADVDQGIPYVVLAFKCEGEIWGSRD